MGKRRRRRSGGWPRASLATVLQCVLILSALLPYYLPAAHAQPPSTVGTIKPTTFPLLFGSSGNIEIDIPKPGIAVRIEIPREFLQIGGISIPENDTSFITSNIRNDYYYYNLVDESKHWTYDWQDNASDGACFKPNFSYYDPNAPYCLEIWNYLNSTQHFKQPDYTILCYDPSPTSYDKGDYDLAKSCSTPSSNHLDYTYLVGVDYCQPPYLDEYVFQCFSASPAAPKFVLLHGLSSPGLAGVYNFTLSVTNRTNILGYPDFVHAWNTTLHVPVSMAYNAGSIVGNVCDAGSGPPFCTNQIKSKGIVYALQCPSSGICSLTTATIVARAYVDQSQCYPPLWKCGTFSLTGLAPGNYLVEGSAGVDVDGVAYSLTPLGYQNPTPTQVAVSANSVTTIGQLPLRRAPLVCGSISYYNQNLQPILSLSGNANLIAAGFTSNPDYELNITVEATDPSGHVFRFQGVSTGGTSDQFILETGMGVKYVGRDPYGTEFAGLPAPEDIGPGGYTLSVNVYVSGYVQRGTESVTITQSPGTAIPACAPINQPIVSPSPVSLVEGGVITGTLQFCSTYLGTCNLEGPATAQEDLPITVPWPPDTLFGGNILIEAYDSTGLLSGVVVINGTALGGTTEYPSPICLADDSVGNCAAIRFYIIGFSEYYNHTLSGVWHTYAPDFGHDYGLPDGQYSLSIFVRGYELTSTSPSAIPIVGGSNQTVTASMTRGGAFEVTVGSYTNRPNSTAIQAPTPTWLFLNSPIPVEARVYFYSSTGTVGFVDRVIEEGVTNGVDTNLFTVLFAGQNWSLREIWFYGFIPTHITDGTYTIEAYTLGYVPQNGGGSAFTNNLLGFVQASLVLFVGNEAEITAPLFTNPQTLTTTPEYDQAIGQAYSPGLTGAETANLTAGASPLEFNIYGFGGMTLDDALCPLTTICGQGHFFYVDPSGTRYFDFGMGAGTYTTEVPEFGFNVHFLQASAPPTISFTDLFLEAGVVFSMLQMATITEGSNSLVQGFCSGNGGQICLNNMPLNVAPLSWAQVQAANSTYSRIISTSDGTFDGVGALFVPAGTYDITFSDIQYISQTYMNEQLGWGSTLSLTPNPPLCPTGGTCP